MSRRDEAIQVAAVAVAMVTDGDEGSTLITIGNPQNRVLLEVYGERIFQENKWGTRHHDPEVWMMILAEEVGELAQEVLNDHHGAMSDTSMEIAGSLTHLISAGLLAKAWLESPDRDWNQSRR